MSVRCPVVAWVARLATAAMIATTVVICGCAALPDVPAGVCGNRVVEGAEDCDTFAPDVTSICRAPGTAGECHLDCTRRRDATRATCPAGWGCALDGICRAPAGDFDPVIELDVGGASSLIAGDFDGDGRDDVVSRGPLDAFGRSKLRFHYFDERADLVASRLFPKLVASPLIGDVSSDGRSDVVFSDFRVGVLVGQGDRSWVPETFGSFFIPGGAVRMVSVHDGPVGSDTGVVALATLNGVPGWYLPDETGMLRRRGDVPGALDSLIGDPVSANIIEDPDGSPCRELITAVAGAPTFTLLDICLRVPEKPELMWRPGAELVDIALEPLAPIDAAPIVADVNRDGHLDVLLGAGGKLYVSYGDGTALAAAVPYTLELASPEVPLDVAMPLAADDFSGDGVVDFVFPDRLLVSRSSAKGAGPTYAIAQLNVATRWTEAVIADFNGNGKVDVAAASSGRSGIDFFNGTGSPDLIPFSIPTDRAAAHLAVGDFDGDLINDLAFLEAAPIAEERDSLMLSFGAPAGAPIAPSVIARIARIKQITVFNELGRSNLVISSTEGEGPATQGVFTFLDGNSDRLPYAPQGLASFSPDGYLTNSNSLGLSVGDFTGRGYGDVMAVSTQTVQRDDWQVWLLPQIGSAGTRPSRLGWKLDPRLLPAHPDGVGVAIDLVSAAADFDGDGRDEALWAMPVDTVERCALQIVGGSDGSALVARPLVVLDEPCTRAQVQAVDADGDGHPDIALLTGSPGRPQRKLLLLWNDGAGSFSADRATLVNPASDSPEGFAVLAAIPERPLSFVYATDGAAELVSVGSTPRSFAPPLRLASLRQGSGVVAADVNGDDAVDLVVAAAGNLSLLKARLRVP